MPEFTVFLKSTATIGVRVAAADADEAEAIAERDHFGPKTAGLIDFGTWDVAAGESEPYSTERGLAVPEREEDWVPQHIAAKRHHQWTNTKRAALSAPTTTEGDPT